jgi:hypothetical protein
MLKFIDKLLRRSEMKPIKWRHICNPQTEEFYHLDEYYNVWTCDCKSSVDTRISLCLTQCEYLQEEGKLREIKREIAQKRKELGLLLARE